MNHLPECSVPWIRECICTDLRLYKERILNELEEAIENMSKEDGGYCFVVHHCEVLEEIELMRTHSG